VPSKDRPEGRLPAGRTNNRHLEVRIPGDTIVLGVRQGDDDIAFGPLDAITTRSRASESLRAKIVATGAWNNPRLVDAAFLLEKHPIWESTQLRRRLAVRPTRRFPPVVGAGCWEGVTIGQRYFSRGNAASTGPGLLHADSVTSLQVMNVRVHRVLIRVIWLVLVRAYPSTHRRRR
jgi:hypothetical protein